MALIQYFRKIQLLGNGITKDAGEGLLFASDRSRRDDMNHDDVLESSS
jgi:hypothetical protein